MENIKEIESKFNTACEHGELYTIRTLIKSNIGVLNLENNDGYGFKKACEKGFVNVIDYLIKTTEVSKNISLELQENIGFFIACEYEQKEIIDYYFKQDDYKNKLGLINKVYITACEKNNKEMYNLLKNLDLLKKVNFKWNKWYGFKLVCKNENNDIINDIINERDLNLEIDLKEWIKEEKYERILNIFKKREIIRQLNKK